MVVESLDGEEGVGDGVRDVDGGRVGNGVGGGGWDVVGLGMLGEVWWMELMVWRRRGRS